MTNFVVDEVKKSTGGLPSLREQELLSIARILRGTEGAFRCSDKGDGIGIEERYHAEKALESMGPALRGRTFAGKTFADLVCKAIYATDFAKHNEEVMAAKGGPDLSEHYAFLTHVADITAQVTGAGGEYSNQLETMCFAMGAVTEFTNEKLLFPNSKAPGMNDKTMAEVLGGQLFFFGKLGLFVNPPDKSQAILPPTMAMFSLEGESEDSKASVWGYHALFANSAWNKAAEAVAAHIAFLTDAMALDTCAKTTFSYDRSKTPVENWRALYKEVVCCTGLVGASDCE